jgi:serine/threonine-protein kinase RsbW
MSQIIDNEFEITVLNKLENLPVIAKFVNDSLQKFGMEEGKIFDMNVAVDEACTNIIQHAYSPDEEGKIEIRCKVVNENKCAVSIKDQGKPFDQSALGPVDTTSPLEERKPGGLGLFFIRELVDEIYYEYKGGFEILTMVKSLS